jgi:alkylation response protein AidB-like acyl-CoA dehydrogenase
MPDDEFDPGLAVAALEGFGEGCADAGFLLAVGAHSLGAGAPIRLYGGSAHRSTLDAMRTGAAVAALAATEPAAGSDVMSLTTSYQAHGDEYVLSGSKCFITNAGEADLFVVFATRDPRLHSRGISAFVVPVTAPGLTVRVDSAKSGPRGCSIGSVRLDRVPVPSSALIGGRDAGAAVFRDAMLWERSLIMACQVGILRRHLEACLEQARNRHQFRRPIGTNQYVAGRVVDLLTRYLLARLLVADTANRLADGTATPAVASITKLWVSEAAVASAIDATRIFSGAGLLADPSTGADVHDALSGLIYSGTSDLQRVIIAAELGLGT